MKVEIALPKSAKLAFSPPKKVKFGDVIFKTTKKRTVILNISHELKIEPQKIYNYLKKLIGETVKKGEILAEKKSIFSKKIFKSPYTGKIIEINHLSGTLTLEINESDFFENFTDLKGEILEKKEQKLILDIKEPTKIKLKKTNLSNLLGGEIFKIKNDYSFTKEEVKDKVILMEKTSEYIENKLAALKAKALITLYHPIRLNFPFAQLSKVNDFNLAFQHNKKYTLIDPFQNILYIYN